MAEVLLELSKCRFPAIGALVESESGEGWHIGSRPITFNMNEIVARGNFPPKLLASQGTFGTANEYFSSLADDHLRHLETQRNGAVIDESDCRKKYIARCLFRKIAGQFSTTFNHEPFMLLCEDLRPANLLVDQDFNVAGVVDWEFSYSAPAEFFHCTPWWLLLGRPETWEAGFDDFLAHYIPRQQVFLDILQNCEEELFKNGAALDSPRLSEHMAQSLKNGQFWFFLAATYGWTFDDVYWKFLHPKYYETESLHELELLLSPEEQQNIGTFVVEKMNTSNDGKFILHEPIEAMMKW
ncbi:predicted protein [Uncinocarpus reesii 1704]|uniref:Uncharacterized protein n=1 Tax=Uncinocarpus reesii (strain UAMH 1704) TaxID=336963 RepID=C4JKK4_UNCRE|nr:uncharacterized protein UREG_02161 [Uncinocarpus reesii 1704]EEP77312.1 predicted protein [Uncinocarpus reesii 1704]